MLDIELKPDSASKAVHLQPIRDVKRSGQFLVGQRAGAKRDRIERRPAGFGLQHHLQMLAADDVAIDHPETSVEQRLLPALSPGAGFGDGTRRFQAEFARRQRTVGDDFFGAESKPAHPFGEGRFEALDVIGL